MDVFDYDIDLDSIPDFVRPAISTPKPICITAKLQPMEEAAEILNSIKDAVLSYPESEPERKMIVATLTAMIKTYRSLSPVQKELLEGFRKLYGAV